MKKIIPLTIFVLSALFVSSLYAEEAHPRKGEGMQQGMSDQDMERFNEHMTEMRQMMERLHKTGDPEEHNRLMHEHMQSLHEGMAMMRGMGGGMMMGEGMGKGEDMEHRQGKESKSDRERYEMLEKRMDIMQMMMEQMMQHQQEAESQHGHGK